MQDFVSGVLVQDFVSGVLVQDPVSGVLVQDLGISGMLGHGGGLWGRQDRRRNWGGKRRGKSLVERGRY